MPETFGQRLRRLVRTSGLDQAAIARHAGLSVSYLNLLMRDGVESPSLVKLEGLARALDTSVEYLRFGQSEPAEQPFASLAQFKGWLNGAVLQHINEVIDAEVERRMTERVPVVRVDEATFRRIVRAARGQVAAGDPRPIYVEPADEEYWHDERNFRPQQQAS